MEIAAYIAADIFNEGMASLLYYMKATGITLGRKIIDRRARERIRYGRMARRQHQLELLKAAKAAEGLLYGPGIDDSKLKSFLRKTSGKFTFFRPSNCT